MFPDTFAILGNVQSLVHLIFAVSSERSRFPSSASSYRIFALKLLVEKIKR